MASTNVVLYVGSALTEAPVEFVKLVVEAFRSRLKSQGFAVLDFMGLTKGTASEVVDKDLGNVAECTHLITFVDYPSTGLGMELRDAILANKPILCLYRKDRRITRMVTGHEEQGKLVMESYGSVEEAYEKTVKFLASH